MSEINHDQDARGKVPILSFFSGAGFLDIGFLRQGEFEFVWHNECHRPFAQAYEYGVGRLGYNTSNNKIQSHARVQNLRAEKIQQQAFGGDKPKIFGVIGGPPCPDFSRAGKNGGGKGESGRLTAVFARMILKLRPTFFLLENVPGLLETKKHRNFLFNQLQKIGAHYAVDMKILNALEYGVPQHRRRLFIVGMNLQCLSSYRNDGSVIKQKSKDIVGMDVSESKTARDVDAVLSKNHWFDWPRGDYKLADVVANCPKKLTVDSHFSRINGHPNADDAFRPYSPKFSLIQEGDMKRKSFKRLNRKLYSPNAAYGNNEVHLHPTEDRRISVAEALSLQGVPAEYSFPDDMTLSAKFKAVGNGVPVPLAESMARSIFVFLKKGINNGII